MSNKLPDDYYFKVPNIQNSQWAGFIAADGCVRKGNRGITIAVTPKDVDILNNLSEDIRLHSKVNYIIYQDKRSGKYYDRNYIDLSNKYKPDLMLNFNISERKSLTLLPPNITDDNLVKAYIIGLMNGDGHIGTYKKRYIFQLTGTYEICSWVREFYRKMCNDVSPAKQIYKRGNIYTFSIEDRKAIGFVDKLLGLNCYYMPRKWSLDNIPSKTKKYLDDVIRAS